MTDKKDAKKDTNTKNNGKYDPIPDVFVEVEGMEKVDKNKSFKAIRQNKK